MVKKVVYSIVILICFLLLSCKHRDKDVYVASPYPPVANHPQSNPTNSFGSETFSTIPLSSFIAPGCTSHMEVLKTDISAGTVVVESGMCFTTPSGWVKQTGPRFYVVNDNRTVSGQFEIIYSLSEYKDEYNYKEDINAFLMLPVKTNTPLVVRVQNGKEVETDLRFVGPDYKQQKPETVAQIISSDITTRAIQNERIKLSPKQNTSSDLVFICIGPGINLDVLTSWKDGWNVNKTNGVGDDLIQYRCPENTCDDNYQLYGISKFSGSSSVTISQILEHKFDDSFILERCAVQSHDRFLVKITNIK